MPHPLTKFNEKHGGEFVKPVRPTILVLGSNYVQKGVQSVQKWSYLNFYKGSEFGLLKNSTSRRFVQNGRFKKMTEENVFT